VHAFAGENLVYQFGDFELESGRRVLRSTVSGETVSLTPRAFDLLHLFVRRPNVLISKEELIEALWPDTVVEDNNLDHAVFTLRQALGERRGEHQYVKTIHRRGYQFTALVQMKRAGAEGVTPSADAPQAGVAPVAAGAKGSSRRAVMALSAAALVVAAAVAAWLFMKPVATAPGPEIAPMLAVMPLRTADDDGAQLVGESVTRLLQQRFSAIDGLPVIAPESTWTVRNLEAGPAEIGRRLQAQYLLTGKVSRAGSRLHLDVALIDAGSGGRAWSQVFERPIGELGAIREEIVRQCAQVMHFQPRTASNAATAPVDLDVFMLYERGMRLMGAAATVADTRKATALFSRSTTLDPRFARGYLGLGQSLIYTVDLEPSPTGLGESEVVARARQAVDRALELDPELGEAWITRARVTADPAQAEQMFRRGLRLAPNYTVGSMFYSFFLTSHARAGESIDVIDRARRYDPRSATLLWLEAQAIMESRSDVDTAENLLEQALALEPNSPNLSIELAFLRLLYRGQVADSVRLMETRLDVEAGTRAAAAMAYVDAGDLEGAIQVWHASELPPQFELMVISQYRRDTRAAAQTARSVLSGSNLGLFDIAAESIRDDALARRDMAPALALLEAAYAEHPSSGTASSTPYEFAIVYAHTLILAGQVEKGRALARSLLVTLDSDEIGRPAHWFARERAALLVLLGENDKAISELALNQKMDHWYRWWYVAEIDPIYEGLRKDPRFIELAEAARRYRATQKTLLDDMRRKGEIPTRAAPRAAL